MKRFVALVLIVGLAIVLVSCGGPKAAAPSQPQPASIKITSAPVLLTKQGDTAQLQATVYDQNGDALNGQHIAWSSSNSSDVSVTGAGLVTANVSVGSAIVTASSSGLSAQALVPVAQLAPATRKIDKSLVTNVQVNSDTSITVTLKDQGAAANLAVGDIIVSNAGVMARVTSLTNSGGSITAQATPVTLDDAFTALHFTATGTPPTITTSITPQGVRLTSTSPTIAPQSLDLSAVECKTSAGDPVTLDITAGSLTYTLNPSFTPTGDKQAGGQFTFSAVASLKPRVTIASPTLTLNVGANVTATCTVPALKPITLHTPVTLDGILSVDGLITPVVGFTVKGSVTGASLTVTGPSLTGAGADASFGISYASGNWTTSHTATRVPGTFKPLDFTADGNPSLNFTLSPFVEPKLGLSLDVTIFHVAGVDFADPKLALDFNLGLTSPFTVSNPAYAGPDWSADLDASVGFGLSLTGEAAKAFNSLNITNGIASASFDLFKWEFLHSPQPAATPSTTTVTNSVNLATTVPKRYQGDTLEFWGYPTGGSSASKLASTTIQSDGSATTPWTPTVSDNGSMTVYAALYGDAFKILHYPYATPTASRPTLTINTSNGSTPPSITSFTPNPPSITSGQSSTLSWTVTGTTPITLSIDNGVGDVTGKTSTTVTPTSTTTYTLTASNAAGKDTKQATVQVNTPTPSITSFKPSPNPVTAGSPTTFTWTISNPGGTLTCTLDPGDGTTPLTVGDCGSTTSQAYTYTSSTGSPYTATLAIQGTSVSDTTSVTVNSGGSGGAVSFAPNVDYQVGVEPWSIAVADFNGDSRPDIVTANNGDNTLSVLLGSGAGAFGTQNAIGVGSGPNYVTAADVNGDGNPDIIATFNNDQMVWVFLGNGTGGFGTPSTYIVGSYPTSVGVADINGDGKPDIVAAVNNQVSALLGTGGGAFGTASTYSLNSGAGAYGIAVADVNGDGHPDIITANEADNDVSVLLGDGNGGFGSQATFPVGNSPYSVAVADVNGDGKPDIVTTNQPDNEVSVLLGDGNGGFGTQATFPTAGGPYAVAIKDVNGDGKPDIVTANWTNTVSVLLQQ